MTTIKIGAVVEMFDEEFYVDECLVCDDTKFNVDDWYARCTNKHQFYVDHTNNWVRGINGIELGDKVDVTLGQCPVCLTGDFHFYGFQHRCKNKHQFEYNFDVKSYVRIEDKCGLKINEN